MNSFHILTPVSLKSMLILLFYVCLDLQGGSLSPGFITKVCMPFCLTKTVPYICIGKALFSSSIHPDINAHSRQLCLKTECAFCHVLLSGGHWRILSCGWKQGHRSSSHWDLRLVALSPFLRTTLLTTTVTETLSWCHSQTASHPCLLALLSSPS
jgi:hypothetical protein